METTQTLTASMPVATAYTLIERAGIAPQIVTDRKGRESTKWIVPEEAQPLIGFEWTWATDEALNWALTIIAAADEPEMLVWS